jgi:hypothetical protein
MLSKQKTINSAKKGKTSNQIEITGKKTFDFLKKIFALTPDA